MPTSEPEHKWCWPIYVPIYKAVLLSTSRCAHLCRSSISVRQFGRRTRSARVQVAVNLRYLVLATRRMHLEPRLVCTLLTRDSQKKRCSDLPECSQDTSRQTRVGSRDGESSETTGASNDATCLFWYIKGRCLACCRLPLPLRLDHHKPELQACVHPIKLSCQKAQPPRYMDG